MQASVRLLSFAASFDDKILHMQMKALVGYANKPQQRYSHPQTAIVTRPEKDLPGRWQKSRHVASASKRGNPTRKTIDPLQCFLKIQPEMCGSVTVSRTSFVPLSNLSLGLSTFECSDVAPGEDVGSPRARREFHCERKATNPCHREVFFVLLVV